MTPEPDVVCLDRRQETEQPLEFLAVALPSRVQGVLLEQESEVGQLAVVQVRRCEVIVVRAVTVVVCMGHVIVVVVALAPITFLRRFETVNVVINDDVILASIKLGPLLLINLDKLAHMGHATDEFKELNEDHVLCPAVVPRHVLHRQLR